MSDIHSINEAINKRAGRKLGPSIVVGVSLLAIVYASLVFNRILFATVVLVATLLGVREIIAAFKSKDIYLSRSANYAAAIAIAIGAWFGGIRGLLVATVIALIISLISLLRKGVDNFVAKSTAAAFAIFYIPFLAGFFILLARPYDGFERVATAIILVASNDTFGYLVGVLIGRHKLVPKISPKKSVEGLLGSIIFTVIFGILTFNYLLKLPIWLGVAVGLLVVFTATTGDLVESALKRDFALKDMSQFLPGHGGIMDRLDSILFSGAALWLVLELAARYL